MADGDVLVALAMVMVRMKHEERVSNDRSMEASARAQEAAHARKIEKMHELADDVLMEGIVSGALEGAGAIASGIGAVTKFSADMKGIEAKTMHLNDRAKDLAFDVEKSSKILDRKAGLIDAAGKGFGASSRFAGALCKSAQERDRTAMAEADAAKDAAKAAGDSAASTVNRANEDIRAMIAALRQLIAAKSQLANAAIIRG